MIKEKLKKSWEWTKRNVKKVLIGIGILGVATAITIPLIPDRVPDIALEKMTEKYSQAPGIQAKYQMERASLKRVAKADPKDRIEVIVGDEKGNQFKPRLEIQRWDNEVSFSVELKDTETGNPTLDFVGDKIKWSKGNIEIEYYDYEDGYKMVWFLKEKPLTNKVEFSFQSKGLNFYYQPPLTQKYQSGYSEELQQEIIVTETQIKDLEGNVLAERPENVVGSYVFYHKTKGGLNDINGKDYKTGQGGIMYRPHITDAVGNETWGIYHLDIENETYAVEIPQSFLDKAIYPIKSNDTFGFESDGGSDSFSNADFLMGSYFTTGLAGTVTSIHVLHRVPSPVNVVCAIYKHSDLSRIGYTEAIGLTTGDNLVFKQFDIVSGGSIDATTNYYLVSNKQTTGDGFPRANTGGVNLGITEGQAYGSWANPIVTPTVRDLQYSIYATYTPEAPPAAEEEGQTMIIEQD